MRHADASRIMPRANRPLYISLSPEMKVSDMSNGKISYAAIRLETAE